MSQYIKISRGYPKLSDFASGEGSPIIIDVTTGIAYYVFKNIIYPIQGGTSVTGAFSDGFSTGFS